MRRPYLAFIALGIVFIGFAVSGRSNIYYGVAAYKNRGLCQALQRPGLRTD